MINIDQLKKKIIYRSNYRGTKEMDNLLGAFTKKYINNLNENDLLDLEKLLNIDDTNLYNFYNGFKISFFSSIINIGILFLPNILETISFKTKVCFFALSLSK